MTEEKFTVLSVPQMDLYGTETRETVGETRGRVQMITLRRREGEGVRYAEKIAYMYAERRPFPYLPYMKLLGASGAYLILEASHFGQMWLLKCLCEENPGESE